ncbi:MULTISPECIES: PTS sugar transporter subunit IIB [Bacillota]|uniref:PTS mannose/fructose/sorbose transporter subunit IIB n=1 Tax=Faecalicoccus pleomorphus TaxID=1323 RepID=A0A3E3E8N4_9FIRM|nr:MULTISPECIES: PTS sugar transporter subunit IIB [Bacillota]MBE6119745.1 PTS sugar transporter subunit IIB [Erysipelotrichaceae bacterium]MDB7980703.1 PTS sugar transporter subunit IIB [Faecalicoccus pleomorphus]MDB7982910.1 PTS sugar transporter subunit IIB [Faecalicoccus pleomorphus]MDB7983915.1 PTS sugar transporter subunit IIB [Faecalicoccus pleomorphus]MDB7989418.1 PTS sugar transporter subunit IIB [Faecalicoccus pleomorphus]
MADIRLVRVDFRLIHGQVITKWFGTTRANQIIIIDDELSKDPFMASIYEMSAPPGAKVTVFSVEKAVEEWNKNQLGDGKLLVLFKNVNQIYSAWELGFPFKEIQIGGLGSAPGRKVVFGPITLNDEDAKKLKQMNDNNVRVYLHQVPEEGSAELIDVLKKNNFDI